jgi:hypothetical protein
MRSAAVSALFILFAPGLVFAQSPNWNSGSSLPEDIAVSQQFSDAHSWKMINSISNGYKSHGSVQAILKSLPNGEYALLLNQDFGSHRIKFKNSPDLRITLEANGQAAPRGTRYDGGAGGNLTVVALDAPSAKLIENLMKNKQMKLSAHGGRGGQTGLSAASDDAGFNGEQGQIHFEKHFQDSASDSRSVYQSSARKTVKWDAYPAPAIETPPPPPAFSGRADGAYAPGNMVDE